MSESIDRLATLLADARRQHKAIADAPADLVPADADAAYAVQLRTLDVLGEKVGAWKVGAKSPSDLPNCAPIPASRVVADKATQTLADFFRPGLELEIAFRLHRDIPPGPRYDDKEVFAHVGETLVTIEITDSRFAAKGADLDKRFALADLQNNGALAIGTGRDYDAGLEYVQPKVAFTLDATDLTPARPGNPAGDPRALVVWLVNHNSVRGIRMHAGDIITCGSYVGMIPATGAGVLRGTIEGIGEASITLR